MKIDSLKSGIFRRSINLYLWRYRRSWISVQPHLAALKFFHPSVLRPDYIVVGFEAS